MTCDGDFCNKPLDIKAARHLRRKKGFMTLGTKTLLLGVHQVFLHGWFVWAGWIRCFGWTWDPRIIIACFIHDFGYWSKPNLDGTEGETHPYLAAQIMHLLFDPLHKAGAWDWRVPVEQQQRKNQPWFWFTLLHSRSLAKVLGHPVSCLYYADKMAQVLEPSWMYVPRAWWTGEIHEYFASADRDITWDRIKDDKTLYDLKMGAATLSPWRWHRGLRKHMAERIKKELTEAGINNRITV